MVDKKDIQETIEKTLTINKISEIIANHITITTNEDYNDLVEMIKCGKDDGYVDGMHYLKDNKQRLHKDGIYNSYRPIDGSTKKEKVTFDRYSAYNGDIENKQVEAQDKVDWTDEEKLAFLTLGEDTGNTIGYQLHGKEWGEKGYDRVADPDEDGFGPFAMDDYGNAPDGAEDWFYYGGIDEYVEGRLSNIATIEKMFDKSPGLQGDQQLFALDIPNPNLKEGDIFELDTFFSATYKAGFQDSKYNKFAESSIDVNIDNIRQGKAGTGMGGLKETDGREHYDSAPWMPSDYPNRKYSDSLPYNNTYKVLILGTDGTPVLVNQGKLNDGSLDYPIGALDYDGSEMTALGYGYWNDYYMESSHDVFFNKGQKMRVVKIDPSTKTAIYQTVNG